MITPKKHKLDLKVVLAAIDTNNYGFYDSLSEEEVKDLSPWVLMRYFSSCADPHAEHHLLAVNEVVNVDFNELKNHKKLQFLLLAACGVGKKVYHPWVAPPKNKASSKKHEILSEFFPNNSTSEIQLMVDMHTDEEMVEFFVENGVDMKDFEAYFK